TFESTMGLPCSHTISEHLVSGQSLEQMYQFWPPHQQATIYAQLEGLVNTPLVLLENPVTIKPRRRLIGAKNKNPRSVRRDLSTFEHVKKRQKQCG
ncbi:8248_t:CDS:2, partial [Gigaspora margarita]